MERNDLWLDEHGNLGQGSPGESPEQYDFGDAAHFTGLYVMATGEQYPNLMMYFTDEKHRGMRYYNQVPWNFYGNFSRDQTMPLVAGLMTQGKYKICRSFFWGAIKRFGFAQNFYRDAEGTAKYPWPHYAHRMRDNPETKTPAFAKIAHWPKPLKSVAKWLAKKTRVVRQEHGGDWVKFDFADPFMPHHIMAMYCAGLMPGHQIVRWLALPTLFLELLTIKYSENDDIGAIFSTAAILGHIDLFRKVVPDYEQRLASYCLGWRHQSGIYNVLVPFIRFQNRIEY